MKENANWVKLVDSIVQVFYIFTDFLSIIRRIIKISMVANFMLTWLGHKVPGHLFWVCLREWFWIKLTFELVGWVKQTPLLKWVGLIQSDQNRSKRLSKRNLPVWPLWWNIFPALDWNSHQSPAIQLQILRLLSLHNHISQFLRITEWMNEWMNENEFIYAYMHIYI
jgi:hypothetical protein